ncbi:MAG TPA: A/G-specific adenine glycosylase [Deltaproteobacteria bacterium]|nr:A/G-specific adenine glycosylase [Deltaproteobacteria bacterium]
MNPSFSVLSRRLLQWYQKHKRDLPWRRTRDPYAIWLSEIMLQQTQVATVIPYYERFLKKFPDIQSLAGASEEQVLALWAGLGYYRRAKLLHRCAREVSEKFQGRFPVSAAALRDLPGIGPYTAGAIASIAFGQAEPLVDGNVIRVLSRLFRKKGHAKAPGLHREIWELARRLIPRRQPGDFNQALMELGATLCRPVLPSCPRCPVLSFCGAAKSGEAESFPETPPSPKTLRLQRAVAVLRRGDAVLLLKPKVSRWFQGMWSLPHEYFSPDSEGLAAIEEYMAHSLGLSWSHPAALPATLHGITHHRIASFAWMGEGRGRLKAKNGWGEARFFHLRDLPVAALPSFDRKVLVAAKILANTTL